MLQQFLIIVIDVFQFLAEIVYILSELSNFMPEFMILYLFFFDLNREFVALLFHHRDHVALYFSLGALEFLVCCSLSLSSDTELFFFG
jgi:hypothetical protein